MAADLTIYNEFPGSTPTRIRRRRHRASWVVGLSALLLLASPLQSDEPKNAASTFRVVLFTGSGENVAFWKLFVDFMLCSADDLDVELDVFYAYNDRPKMIAEIRKVCQQRDKPDAIVVQAFKQSGENSLRIAEQFQVPVFLVNSGLSKEQRETLGAPRERLRYWIGEMLPDDEAAGYRLANALIDEAIRLGRVSADGRVHVLGINGAVANSASIQRAAGLKRAIEARKEEAKLTQIISANWARNQARQRSRILHRRHPQASVIWTASDHMAEGVVDAMGDLGLRPGKDVVIGGVDGTPEGMRMVREGTLHATLGGHFMEGGWVAVLLHDYLKGVDVACIPPRFASPMTLITKTNLAAYQAAANPSTWRRFDFCQLSRVRRPGRKEYQFGANVLADGRKIEAAAPEAKQDRPSQHKHGNSE